jgi:hypothetical protein
MRLFAVAVFTVAACFLCGCGYVGTDAGPSQSVACSRRAGPLTAPVVVQALSRQGFTEVEISRDCSMMARPILNAIVTSGHILDCSIYEPSTSWGNRIRTEGPSEQSSVVWHGTKALAFLENMECQLYPEAGKEMRQMRQLVAALRELKPSA